MLPVEEIRNCRDGAVRVSCLKGAAAEKTKEVLKTKLGSSYKVEIETKARPKLKIVGIDEFESPQQLECDLQQRNCPGLGGAVTVLHTYLSRKTQRYTALVEVSSEAYRGIMAEERVYVGCQRCQVYDDFDVGRCYHCCGYGHSAKKCTRAVACAICAGQHETKKCNEKQLLCCINCIKAKESAKDDRPTDHRADDLEACETHKIRIKRIIEATDYPFLPVVNTRGAPISSQS